MEIIPAILVPTYKELTKQLKKIQHLFAYVQLDIMDGEFVNNKSFNHEENTDLTDFFNKNLTDNILTANLKYELHLMVKNPLQEIAQWQNIKNVFRIIFHIEADDGPDEVINKIRGNCWQAGIALNPDTPLKKIMPYLDKISLVLFMTVHPGQQGAIFVRGVKNKIIEFAKIPNHPLVAVDGGINQDTIREVKSWGVDIFNVGSALMLNNNIKKTLKTLNLIYSSS